MKKVVFITGITGQDGSYLTELLLKKNYIVHGLVRPSSFIQRSRLDKVYGLRNIRDKKLILHYGDVLDANNLLSLIKNIKPSIIFNLAAQSHVKISFENANYTTQVNAIGTLNILEIIKNYNNKIKFYQASTSELFGGKRNIKLSEKTLFNPLSPYSVSKNFAFEITKMYREAYGLFASNGILFNHESPRRNNNFVTKKIVNGVVRISRGENFILEMGNLEARRDWGYAPEYVEGMLKIMEHSKPDDFVLATNTSKSVRQFIELSFKLVGIKIIWKGKGLKEIGINELNKKTLVKVNKNYFRPIDVDFLRGDYSKAKKLLGWKPKIKFEKLVKIMITNELRN